MNNINSNSQGMTTKRSIMHLIGVMVTVNDVTGGEVLYE